MSNTEHQTTGAGRYLSLLLFLLLVLGGGLGIGLFSFPDGWYFALVKPSFNPPPWIFGPVWTLLYIMIAVAGWLVWTARPQSTEMKLWWLQLILNFAWSPAFFGLHAIGLALAIIVALLITIIAFVVLAWRNANGAALLFLPYLAWVGFASLLNGAIFALNG